MKYCIFISITIFLLSGCSKINVTPQKEIAKSFHCEANITMGGSDFKCDISRQEQGMIQFDIKEPEAVSGVCFKWLGDKYETSYKGLSCNTESSTLPETSFVNIITDILNIVTTSQDTLGFNSENEGIYEYSGKLDNKNFIIKVNNNGEIQKILSNDFELDAEFVEFKISDSNDNN